jgi:RHS repeat-associated protein
MFLKDRRCAHGHGYGREGGLFHPRRPVDVDVSEIVREAGKGWVRALCMASNLSFRLTIGCLLAVVCGAVLLSPAFASASLSAIEVEHVSEIEEWVYRNGAVESPLGCTEMCNRIWTAEHRLSGSPAAQEIWEAIGDLETSGTGLWGNLSSLKAELGAVALGAKPLRVGWHIARGGLGPDKWLELIGPEEPLTCGTSRTRLKLPGEEVTPTFHAIVKSPGDEWYLLGCGSPSEMVAQQVKEKANPEGTGCGETASPPSLTGWTRQEWWWNECYEGFYMGHEAFSKVYASAYYTQFHFSPVKEWAGQKLEGEATDNVETTTAGDPGSAAVKAAIEHELELSRTLSTWIEWILEGEPGPDPTVVSPGEEYGPGNEAAPHKTKCMLGHPVNCATGNQVETQTDLAVGGRGPGFGLTRTYNSQLAVSQSAPGSFGYGWTASYDAHLEMNEEQGTATVYQDDGSTVRFSRSGEQWVASGPLVQATLAKEGSEYRFTLPTQRILLFNGTGQLTSIVDRNGNTLTMNRNAEGRLESVSDSAGRKLTFAYNAEGFVKSVTDPMGHVAKYAYEGDNLMSVTEPGETSPRWQFKYNTSHELTTETDGLAHSITTEYDGSHRVTAQTDALERKRTWEYAATETGPRTTVIEPNGSTTVEQFNAAGRPTSITHASGTSSAATTTYEYDEAYNSTAVTDPNKHTTKYTYDGSGDKTSETDPNGDERKWTYDSKHDVETETTPKGEKTTIKRDANGNAEVIERPAPESTTQTTKYKYDEQGDLTEVTDPFGHKTKYTYDAAGDKKSETDAEGNVATWEYNEDSQVTATISPRGNAEGAEAAKFTTTIERDPQGRPLLVTGPEANGTSAPVDKTAASISGAARETQTLTAGTGIWEGTPSLSYAYQWQHCNSLGGSCANISSATSATYALTSGDVGMTLRVVVTATNSWGSAPSTSAATSVVAKASALGAEYPPQFSMKFGSTGSSNGQFKQPRDVAVDSSGNVWVADTNNNRVQEFSSSGEYLRQFGSEGAGNGQFKGPANIAFAANGNLWVTDSLNDRVEEFSPTGEYIAQFGAKGTGNGQFTEPVGIAIASSGNIWVTDARDYRVEEFSSTGEYITKIGTNGSGNGQFFHPTGIAIDPSGHVWIADTRNNRMQELTSTGEYLSKFGSEGTGNGQFKEPAGIAVDLTGNLWVADTRNNRIQEFTNTGEYITQFGTKGSGNGQFVEPEELVVDQKYNLWIADTVNNRMQELKAATAPSIASSPSISGELIVGQALSASTGIWTAIPNPTYTYQWRRCNTTGGECSNIPSATSATYVPAHADVGSTIRVVVKATNPAGSSESTSAATEVAPRMGAAEYAYDANGDLLSVTNPDGHKTTYTYDADSERTKVEAPNKTITETEYDADGNVIAQVDGSKHTTKYKRNALEEVTEVVDPLGHKTLKEYDTAGNLLKVTDPKGRTTTDAYDPANRLTEVSYSSGNPSATKYEYDKDGERTKMVDGTGTTTYTYDQLDRLTESENGHKEAIKYEYNLGGQQTKITYPNEKSVTRAFDKDGRLEKITDWSANVTKFTYDAGSNLATTVFPSATEGQDTYVYNNADRVTEIKMAKGTETLASLAYSRDDEGQLKTTTSKGLPGTEVTEHTYDENNRLTKSGSTEYKYDAANNPTTEGSSTNTYNEGNELEKGTGVAYAYDELGERIKTTPETGPATTYGYDQAGNLISVERPKEGETAVIKDAYAYNGEGLRTSQTISGTTTYMAWDLTEPLPVILSDTTNSYIYGPGGIPVEQINNSTGAVTYLHHDQAGSTRLLTGSTGSVTGKCTYGVYGTQTCEGTATTPLGYDGQYTSGDTGLIYMRARTYDPVTAQFLSVDPMVGITRAPYNYAGDNPLNYADRSGLGEGEIELPCVWPFCAPPPPVTEGIEGIVEGGREGAEGVAHGAESILNKITGGGGSLPKRGNDEKTHGKIPSYPPSGATPEELEGALEDLETSIPIRERQLLEEGEHKEHRERLEEEKTLRRQIEKKLGCGS